MLTLPAMSTAHHPRQPTRPLSARWHLLKCTASQPKRLLLRCIEMLFLTTAMFVLPFAMHSVVQCFDSLHELLGRQARSPFASTRSLAGLAVSGVLVGVWHVCLGRLSYCVVLDGEDGDYGARGERGVSWGRVLGRIVVPLGLLGFTVQFVYHVSAAVAVPDLFVTGNTVTLDDDVRLSM